MSGASAKDRGGVPRNFISSKLDELSLRVQDKLIDIHALNADFARYGGYLVVLTVFLFFLLGALYFRFMEGWDYLDCFYFCVITFLTIGYGDLHPQNNSERLFTAFYIILGVSVGGSFIGIMSSIIQDHNDKMENARNEKTAKKTIKRKSSYFQTPNLTRNLMQSIDKLSAHFPAEEHSSEACNVRRYHMQAYDDDLRYVRAQTILDLAGIAVLLLFSLCMCSIEGWSSITAFYWACVTIATVGYGDVVPTTNGGKVFTILYSLVGCTVLAKSLTSLIKYPLLVRSQQAEKRLFDQFFGKDNEGVSSQTLKMIKEDDLFAKYPSLRDKAERLTKAEFLLLVLKLMDKLSDKDIILVNQLFDSIDKDGNGYLSTDEIDRSVVKAQAKELERRTSVSGSETSEDSRSITQRVGGSFLRTLSIGSASDRGVGDNSLAHPLL